MDSTIHVANDTALVIAMEVTVIKAAHHAPYHSHTNLSRDYVETLTEQIAQHTRHADETNYRAPARRRLY